MPDIVLHVLWIAVVVVGSVVRRLGTRSYRRGEGIKEARPSRLESLLMIPVVLGMLVIPVLYIASPWLEFADYGLGVWPALGVGLAGATGMGIGIWLLWRTHVELGKNWSPTVEVRDDHSLVTSGVFRRIRHPMYAAHFFWALGQVLLLQNWIAGPAMLLLFLPLYFYRVGREERMMLDHFGDEYRDYMKRTGRIVPRF